LVISGHWAINNNCPVITGCPSGFRHWVNQSSAHHCPINCHYLSLLPGHCLVIGSLTVRPIGLGHTNVRVIFHQCQYCPPITGSTNLSVTGQWVIGSGWVTGSPSTTGSIQPPIGHWPIGLGHTGSGSLGWVCHWVQLAGLVGCLSGWLTNYCHCPPLLQLAWAFIVQSTGLLGPSFTVIGQLVIFIVSSVINNCLRLLTGSVCLLSLGWVIFFIGCLSVSLSNNTVRLATGWVWATTGSHIGLGPSINCPLVTVIGSLVTVNGLSAWVTGPGLQSVWAQLAGPGLQ